MADVLSLPLPPDASRDYVKVLSMKKDAAVAVIQLGLKASDSALRRRETGVLEKLLDAIREKERSGLVGSPRPIFD